MPAVLVTEATVMQNSPFSTLTVAVAIVSTHCIYPWRDGQAEFTLHLRHTAYLATLLTKTGKWRN